MKGTGRKFGSILQLVLVIVVLAFTTNVSGQVTVGENTKLNLGGDLSFGYSGARGDTTSSNEVDLGVNANLTGFYYHPQFLNFSINPYYNRNQFNSETTNIFSGKGINSVANLFSGSHTPISVG